MLFAGIVARALELELDLRMEPAGAGEAGFFAALVDGDEPADLAALLPAYMVPELLLPLPPLPLSANGKVDRAALPDPAAAPRSARPPYVAPQSDLERHIAEVWRAELGVGERPLPAHTRGM